MANSNDQRDASWTAFQSPLAVIFVALFALIGIRAPSGSGGNAKSQPSASSDAQSKDPPKDQPALEMPIDFPPLKLLVEHLGPDSSFVQETRLETDRERQRETAEPMAMEKVAIPESRHSNPTNLHVEHLFVRRLLENFSGRSDTRIDCLIATVADPIDSRFQHIFDNSIDAIQRALGQHGYDLDRFLFLWTDDLRELTKSKNPIAKPHRSRFLPSAMLFRHNLFNPGVEPHKTWSLSSNTNSLLMVLLVGETPTTGVHKLALANALEFAATCEANFGRPASHSKSGHVHGVLDGQGQSRKTESKRDAHHSSHDSRKHDAHDHTKPLHPHALGSIRLKLLGPEFSGSSPSLRQGVVDWWSNEIKSANHRGPVCMVDIISGAATSDSNHNLLNYVETNETLQATLAMRFNATVLPDSTTRLALLRHIISTRSIPPEKIALLSERGTVYGRVQPNSSGRENSEGENGSNTNGSSINGNHDPGSRQNKVELDSHLRKWHKLHVILANKSGKNRNRREDMLKDGNAELIDLRKKFSSWESKIQESVPDKAVLLDESWAHRLLFLAGRSRQWRDFLKDVHLESEDYQRIRQINYPLGLSRIRSEFEKSAAFHEENAKTGAGMTRRNVELRLGNVQHSIDTLPIFADVTTPTIDISLEQLLSIIKRDDIRAVGLVGTDVLDKLFLAQQLRAHAPDVVLFTQEYDSLYLHADYATYLNGMIIASSYPLSPRSRGWTVNESKDRDIVLATDTAHGVYNAAIALLNLKLRDTRGFQPVAMLDYRPPFERPPSDGDSARLTGPSVRISMVGETGLWPVDVVSIHDGKHPGAELYVHRPPGPKKSHESVSGSGNKTITNEARLFIVPPRLLPLIVTLLLASVTVATVVVVNRQAHWPRNHGLWRMLLRFAPWFVMGNWHWSAISRRPRRITGLDVRRVKRLWAPRSLRAMSLAGLLTCVAAICLVIASPQLVVARFAWMSSIRGISIAYPMGVYSWWASLMAFLLVVAAIGWSIARALQVWPSLLKRVVLFVAGLGLVLGSGVVVWSASDDIRAAVFIERAGTLGSGVSPLMPVLTLLMALACWFACHLRREYYLRVFRLSNPFPGHDLDGENADFADRILDVNRSANLAGFGLRFSELNAWLKGRPRLPRAAGDWVMGAVFLIWIAYLLPFKWSGTAEGALFDLGYRWLLFVVLIVFFALLIRVRAVAGLFERLLRRLGQHPMVHAFEIVPERLAAKVSGQLFAAAPHPGDLEFSVRCLKRLPWDKGARQGVHDCERRLGEIFGRDRTHQIEALILANRLNADLSRMSREQIVRSLDGYWSQVEVQRERGESSEKGDSAIADDRWRWHREAELFIAMQWIHLIRQVFTHLQNQMLFLIAMLLLVLVSLQIYPFQPRNGLLTFWFGLMSWTVLSIVIAVVKFNRDEVLSRIGRTVPNQFTFDRSLIVPLLTYVVAPIVGILLVWFPVLGRVLFGWLGAIGAWPGA